MGVAVVAVPVSMPVIMRGAMIVVVTVGVVVPVIRIVRVRMRVRVRVIMIVIVVVAVHRYLVTPWNSWISSRNSRGRAADVSSMQ